MLCKTSSLALLLLLATTATTTIAFIPRLQTSVFGGVRSSLALSSARVDATAAIEAAVKASNEFGPTSPEARVAWDAVEEISASDNSAASAGSLDTECDISDDALSKQCEEYNTKLETLSSLMEEYRPKLDTLKSLATEMQAIKLAVVQNKPGTDSPAIRAGLENAKAVEAEFGKGSAESKVAWAELEEIASSGLSNAMGVRLDEECLVESAMEACMALEELSRALNLQKTKEAGGGLNA